MNSRVRLVLALACLVGGCKDEQAIASKSDQGKTSAGGEAKLRVAEPTVRAVGEERVSVLDLMDTCDVSHLGASIDFGGSAAETQRVFSQIFEKDVVPVEHGGGSFAEVLSRKVDYEFRLSEALSELFVSARVRGRRSGSMAVYIDKKRLGSARLSLEEVRIVNFTLSQAELKAGRHELSLQFSRGDAHTEGAYADIEWLRLTSPDNADEQYAAPTLKGIVSDVVLEKRPRRSIALREQSSVRCPLWPAPDTELKLWLGFWGVGSGRAEVRVLRQNEAPVTLAQRELKGGETAGWTPLELPLGKYAGSLIGVEFAVVQARGVGRVAFGNPAFVRTSDKARVTPHSDTVVLVVLSGLRRASLPPWGAKAKLPAFAELVRAGTAFTNYRTPSSVPAAALASMLTGQSPREHALEDPAARLPEALTTLNQALKQASGHAAMFTGVPTSFPAFGFNRFWDEYQHISPVSDESAQAPFESAVAWLKKDSEQTPSARRFVVIHARGAHPPWDVPKVDAAKLKPEEYEGAIDARRGGIALSNIRARSNRASRKLGSDDWTRLYGLEALALKKQDSALAGLVKTLSELGLWEEALVVVVGDVGAGEAPHLPYHPAAPLDESSLYVPLIVKFPGRHLAGKETGSAVTSVDIATTLRAALGLDDPRAMSGLDLYAVADGRQSLVGRAQWATLGQAFATRLGPWRLSGELGKVPALCELGVDPACVNDVFETQGFVATALWKWTYLAEKQARAGGQRPREPASIDAETTAALSVWGDL